MWISCKDNRKYSDLWEVNVKTIEGVSGCFFTLKFNDISEIDVASILYKIERFYNENRFNLTELIDFLATRKISFQLKFKYCKNWNFIKNAVFFILILKLNLTSKLKGIKRYK